MISELNTKDWRQYLHLRNQLSNFNSNITENEFIKKYNDIKANNSFIFVYIKNEKIVGTLMLIILNKIYDNIALIEDVVVDKNHRKQKIGSELVKHVINFSKNYNCYKIITLTKEETVKFYNQNNLTKTGVSFTKFI